VTEASPLQRWLELTNPGLVLVDLPGPVDLQSYGVMMAAAFAVGGWLGQREMDRRGLPGEEAWSLVVWAALGGLVGSRILALFDQGGTFLADPLAWLLTGGGYTFYGGLIGGFVTVTWAMRGKGLPWRPTVDCIAPSLAIGQALGRVGCQLSGDGDWGRATSLPWGMTYPNAPGGWLEPAGVFVHPTPLYEALAYTAVFAYLWATRTRERPPGSQLWLYLVLVPAFRFTIEFWRINPPALGPLSQAQVVSLVLMTIGGVQLARGRAGPGAARAPTAA
jgi:phosphatidylglycerol:prolipoprotein diacylglycerol transferase